MPITKTIGGVKFTVVEAIAAVHPERIQVIEGPKTNIMTATRRIEAKTLHVTAMKGIERSSIFECDVTVEIEKVVENAVLGDLRIGIIQNLLDTTRSAAYPDGKGMACGPSAQQRQDNTAFVDCLFGHEPWYRFETMNGQPYDEDAIPPTMSKLPFANNKCRLRFTAADNPNWPVPIQVNSKCLDQYDMRERFRTFIAVANGPEEQEQYTALAYWEWATDIHFQFDNAQRDLIAKGGDLKASRDEKMKPELASYKEKYSKKARGETTLEAYLAAKQEKMGMRLAPYFGTITGSKATLSGTAPSESSAGLQSMVTDTITPQEFRPKENF